MEPLARIPATIPRHWVYPESLEQAAAVQRELAERLTLTDALPDAVSVVGGADVSNTRFDPENKVYAAMVTLEAASFAVTQTACHVETAAMPYVPGFLAFREVPTLLTAWAQLETKPDVLFVDGHGISHPRRLGIASHLGVVLDCPTIGVAKSILVGQLAEPLGPEPGDRVPLVWKGQVIAVALRTKRRSNPLFIAPGHKISPERAVALVEQALNGYRLPEPTRQAHLAANACRKQAQTSDPLVAEPRAQQLALESVPF